MMEKPEPKLEIRQAALADQFTLRDMDMKCFDEVWAASYWSQWFTITRAILIVEVDKKPAGFVAGELNEDGFCIEKIGVKYPFRRMGVSKMLLAGCQDLITQCPKESAVYLAIPEPWLYDCYDCVTDWIRSVGFKARLPYLKDYFCINGVDMDGVRCELEVG